MAVAVRGGRAPATIIDSYPVADGLPVGGLSSLWCVCQDWGSEVCVRYPGSPRARQHLLPQGACFMELGLWVRGGGEKLANRVDFSTERWWPFPPEEQGRKSPSL